MSYAGNAKWKKLQASLSRQESNWSEIGLSLAGTVLRDCNKRRACIGMAKALGRVVVVVAKTNLLSGSKPTPTTSKLRSSSEADKG